MALNEYKLLVKCTCFRDKKILIIPQGMEHNNVGSNRLAGTKALTFHFSQTTNSLIVRLFVPFSLLNVMHMTGRQHVQLLMSFIMTQFGPRIEPITSLWKRVTLLSRV